MYSSIHQPCIAKKLEKLDVSCYNQLYIMLLLYLGKSRCKQIFFGDKLALKIDRSNYYELMQGLQNLISRIQLSCRFGCGRSTFGISGVNI